MAEFPPTDAGPAVPKVTPDTALPSQMPSPWRLLARGITRRCARCGSGRLFRRWLLMVDDCPRCGYHFEREAGFFLGALVVNIALTELSIVALLVIGFALTLPDPPLWTLSGIGMALGLLVPIVSYPFTKTTWTAIDMIMRRSLGESYSRGSQPGFQTKRAGTGRPGTGS